MIFGVLLITRPSAIFGTDTVPRSVKQAQNYRIHTLLPDDSYPDEHFFYPFPASSTDMHGPIANMYSNKTKTRLYWGPILLSGTFHETLEQHLNSSQSQFTKTQKIVGYVACFAVPFLSALISLITRQCNNKKVPIYILMLWFGIGASCVIFSGEILKLTDPYTDNLRVIDFKTQRSLLMQCLFFLAQIVFGLHDLFDVSLCEMFVMMGITALGMYGNLSYTYAVK